MSRGLVDMHTHFLPRALADALTSRSDFPRLERHPGGAGQIHYGPGSGHVLLAEMESIDVRLADMDRQGIDAAVVGVTVPGVDGFDAADAVVVARDANDELAELVRAQGGRLAALAVLPNGDPDAAAAELERAVSLGLSGALIFSNVRGQPLDSPGMEVVFDAAARLDAPLLLHPTFPLTAATVDAYALVPTIGFLFDTTTAVLRLVLGGLYDRHPDFKLVVPHTASLIPWLVGRIDYEAERMPNGTGALSVPPSEHLRLLYADLVCDWPPAVRLLVDFLGAERVMFGSDYPFWDPARSVKALDAVGLSPADDELVRAGTAERLFGLQRPT
jgi:predicted TIM-barrel fold metal-dependent hydrolase